MAQRVVGNSFIQGLHEKWALRSGSNQAHLSLQDIDHLWNLIDSQFPDNFPYTGYSRIVRGGPDRTSVSFRAFTHGSKFIYGKRSVVLPNSLLTIEYGTWTIEFDSYCRK